MLHFQFVFVPGTFSHQVEPKVNQFLSHNRHLSSKCFSPLHFIAKTTLKTFLRKDQIKGVGVTGDYFFLLFKPGFQFGMQALFKGEITPGTFYFKCTKTLIVAYMWPVLLTWMNVAVQLLLPLPEIAQIVIHAFIISVVYFPILVHFSLESPLRLEHIFYNV